MFYIITYVSQCVYVYSTKTDTHTYLLFLNKYEYKY